MKTADLMKAWKKFIKKEAVMLLVADTGEHFVFEIFARALGATEKQVDKGLEEVVSCDGY